MPGARVHTRLTSLGLGSVGFGLLLAALGLAGSNNLIVLVGVVFLTVVTADVAWGRHQITQLGARRIPPDELYAGLPTRMEWEITGHMDGVVLHDGDHTVAVGASRTTIRAAGWWRGLRRGWLEAGPIVLSSRFPFGTAEHRRVIPTDDRFVVFPEPQGDPGLTNRSGRADGDCDGNRQGAGEVSGLRPYRIGDRRSAIHLPTSERAGAPMIVERGSLHRPSVRIVFDPHAPLEPELSRCTAAVLRAHVEGSPIGLFGLDPTLERQRAGRRWQRHLLEALALVPRS